VPLDSFQQVSGGFAGFRRCLLADRGRDGQRKVWRRGPAVAEVAEWSGVVGDGNAGRELCPELFASAIDIASSRDLLPWSGKRLLPVMT
jgi:hypothetical protein